VERVYEISEFKLIYRAMSFADRAALEDRVSATSSADTWSQVLQRSNESERRSKNCRALENR
jgi:hypothetical protein